MNKVKYLIDNFEYLLGGIFSIMMVTLLFIQVVSRYAFGFSLAFSEEVAVIFFIFTVYLGAIGATRRNQHLKVEILTNQLKPKVKIIAGIIADLIFIVANGFIIYGIIKITGNLMHYGMTTPILQIPKWMCYSMLPFAFTIITFRLIQNIVVKVHELYDIKENSIIYNNEKGDK